MLINKATTFIPMVVFLHLRHNFNKGVYILSINRVIGFAFSGFSFPFKKKDINTGVNVIARIASTSKIKVFTQ